jgi:hypothetical protein
MQSVGLLQEGGLNWMQNGVEFAVIVGKEHVANNIKGCIGGVFGLKAYAGQAFLHVRQESQREGFGAVELHSG